MLCRRIGCNLVAGILQAPLDRFAERRIVIHDMHETLQTFLPGRVRECRHKATQSRHSALAFGTMALRTMACKPIAAPQPVFYSRLGPHHGADGNTVAGPRQRKELAETRREPC